MRQVLFIKTSSLGDVIHHMPALADAKRQFPQARFGWVVEEAFAPLVRLHPLVDDVIVVATRRWRLHPLQGATWRDIARFRRELRANAFDRVIDSQGLIRSAIIARLARGEHHGFDVASIREGLAAQLYDCRHHVPRSLHAIARNRALTGLALGYTPTADVDYGLPRSGDQRQPRAVLLHGTSRPTKEWSETEWIALGRWLSAHGLEILLPWGSEPERQRAGRLSRAIPNAHVPEYLSLDRMAPLIASAALVVGVDTGLLHLAAAYNVPLVGVFLSSDPTLTGPVSAAALETLGGPHQQPRASDAIAAVERVLG